MRDMDTLREIYKFPNAKIYKTQNVILKRML